MECRTLARLKKRTLARQGHSSRTISTDHYSSLKKNTSSLCLSRLSFHLITTGMKPSLSGLWVMVAIGSRGPFFLATESTNRGTCRDRKLNGRSSVTMSSFGCDELMAIGCPRPRLARRDAIIRAWQRCRRTELRPGLRSLSSTGRLPSGEL